VIKLITPSELLAAHTACAVNHQRYIEWLNDGTLAEALFCLPTTNVDIRQRSVWNTFGREVYCRERLLEHASAIAAVVQSWRLANFLAEHEFKPRGWFPERLSPESTLGTRLDLFRPLLSHDYFHHFDGGFSIIGDLQPFLVSVIDYPYLLRYCNVDIFSSTAPVMFKLTHHLSVDIVSSDMLLLREAQHLLESYGIRTVAGNLQ
jgi:hypothetical protein